MTKNPICILLNIDANHLSITLNSFINPFILEPKHPLQRIDFNLLVAMISMALILKYMQFLVDGGQSIKQFQSMLP